MKNKTHYYLSLMIIMITLISCTKESGEIQLLERKIFVDERGRPVDPYVNRQVKNTITANARDAQKCFNDYIEGLGEKADRPDTLKAGEVHLDWTVKRSGKAQDARTVFSPFNHEGFEKCLKKAVESWDFPPPDLDTYAEHRFRFSMQPIEPEPPQINLPKE